MTLMVSKAKINREKVLAALNTVCPKCGYSIPPEKIRRIDFSVVECPSCGERFTPGGGRPRGNPDGD
jgi:ribosomal protein L37AE/L43A